MKRISPCLLALCLAAASLHARILPPAQQHRAAVQALPKPPSVQTQPTPAPLPQPGQTQPVTNVSFDGKEFMGAFNGAADRPRLVLVFSPT